MWANRKLRRDWFGTIETGMEGLKRMANREPLSQGKSGLSP